MYEGGLARQLRQLDELLKQLVLAARVLGDEPIAQRFESCQASIHRGVPFANSLYLTDSA